MPQEVQKAEISSKICVEHFAPNGMPDAEKLVSLASPHDGTDRIFAGYKVQTLKIFVGFISFKFINCNKF